MRIILALITTMFIALLTHLGAAQAAVPSLPACALASEGIYQGYWVKHRIYVNDEVVFGANDMDSILSQLENLRDQGLCR